MKRIDDLTAIIENQMKIEKALAEIRRVAVMSKKEEQDKKYDVCVLKCANDRLLVHIYNGETEEEIRIDETYKDVKKLYQVLKEYFENGEREVIGC